ncbi:hypothetical protein D3C84_1107540 [compost metagenome]
MRMPKVMAVANLSNISFMYSASPYSTSRTPRGRCCKAGVAWIASRAEPMVTPARSASTEIRRSRSKRSILVGPLP